jgi:hypothetical protein
VLPVLEWLQHPEPQLNWTEDSEIQELEISAGYALGRWDLAW